MPLVEEGSVFSLSCVDIRASGSLLDLDHDPSFARDSFNQRRHRFGRRSRPTLKLTGGRKTVRQAAAFRYPSPLSRSTHRLRGS